MEKEDYPPKKYWNNCSFCNDRLINGCYYCTDPILDPDTKFEGRWYEHEARQNFKKFKDVKKPNVRNLDEFVENGA